MQNECIRYNLKRVIRTLRTNKATSNRTGVALCKEIIWMLWPSRNSGLKVSAVMRVTKPGTHVARCDTKYPPNPRYDDVHHTTSMVC